MAYVQLKPGAAATEDELMSFAKAQISERAAIPKAIRLVGALPLTRAGKIFKPALREREILDTLQSALAEAGVTAKIELANHTRLGLQLDVRAIEASAAASREVLGRFPFRFEVSWTG